MKTLGFNLGWDKQSAPTVKKVGLKAYMQRQIAVQSSKKK
jgi:hypothetical protein